MQRLITKREKIIFAATIGIFFFSLFFKFLITPLLNKAEGLNSEIKAKLFKLNKYKQLLAQKEVIREKYTKLSREPNDLPDEKDALVSSLSELQRLAISSGVRIIDIRPQKRSRAENASEGISVDLRTEGSTENYLKFIYDIENSISLYSVNNLQLNSKPNTQILEGFFSISKIPIED